ncbi:hypothetical protein [Mediterraneibacter hominis]|nr:hypothetical protein [Mediterraneibacter hominis]
MQAALYDVRSGRNVAVLWTFTGKGGKVKKDKKKLLNLGEGRE